MITAKEARQELKKKSESAMDKKKQKEREKVEKRIRRAIRRGSQQCGFLSLYKATVEWLEILGYTVTTEYYNDMVSWWVVSW